jgi:signal transduction histidine kinase
VGAFWVILSEWMLVTVLDIGETTVGHLVRGLGLVAITAVLLLLLVHRMDAALRLGDEPPASVRDGRAGARDQRRLSHRLMQAEEETRRAVAKDLHDGALQSLTLSFMQLDAAVRASEDGVNVDPDQVSGAMTAIKDAADEIRAVVRALQPPLLAELGLGPAVERYCRELTSRAHREIVVQRDPALPETPPEASIAIFRIAQEALANALKHTQDGPIVVGLGFEDGGVALDVTDSGPGFDPERTSGGGLGLLSMRERAESIGAQFALTSDAGGTRVSVRVPVSDLVPVS